MFGSSLPGGLPDPTRAHGAWVYLSVSVIAGALSVTGRGVAAALCAGVAYVGIFLMASAFALHAQPARGRLLSGLAIAVGAALAGWAIGADPMAAVFAGTAIFPVAGAAWFAQHQGVRSESALAFAVVALAVAAPSAACAGGAEPWIGFALLAALAPFFAWRTWRTRRELRSRRGWNRVTLRRLGLREAFYAAGWTAAVVVALHVLR